MNPAGLLERLIASRGTDREAGAWAAQGFAAWLADSGRLGGPQRYLGLHQRAHLVRIALRDQWLREAARKIEATTEWQRAAALAKACREFEARRWWCWCGDDVPPARATPVEQALFFARGYEAFPKTERQLRNILSG